MEASFLASVKEEGAKMKRSECCDEPAKVVAIMPQAEGFELGRNYGIVNTVYALV